MKAKVKATGEVFEIESIAVFADRMDGEVGIELLMAHEVEILPTVTELSTEPDWEQRRYEIAKGLYTSFETIDAEAAVSYADLLITELKKQTK